MEKRKSTITNINLEKYYLDHSIEKAITDYIRKNTFTKTLKILQK